MSETILIAYASQGGSTAAVAEAVGETLSASGLSVGLRPVTQVSDLAPYSAVVLGSAIQMGELLPEAMQFVRDYQAELMRRPFAAFVVCMTMSMRPAIFRGAARQFLEPVCALVTPVSEGYFAGVVDFERMMPAEVRDDFFMRWSVRLGIFSNGDHRDWNAIRAWASALSARLH